jgi:hypothetical protein
MIGKLRVGTNWLLVRAVALTIVAGVWGLAFGWSVPRVSAGAAT